MFLRVSPDSWIGDRSASTTGAAFFRLARSASSISFLSTTDSAFSPVSSIICLMASTLSTHGLKPYVLDFDIARFVFLMRCYSSSTGLNKCRLRDKFTLGSKQLKEKMLVRNLRHSKRNS